MRDDDKSSGILAMAMMGFALTGAAAVLVSLVTHEDSAAPAVSLVTVWTAPAPANPDPVTPTADPTELTGAQWLVEMRPYCNPVDVDTRMGWNPAPQTADGAMHRAACLALAGHIDDARAVLQDLPEDERWKGAGVLFNVGHPAADAGNELAAGPLMELVVEFWSNHYMALYHAGASRFESGDGPVARDYLERFLVAYEIEDGWRSSAQQMLVEIHGG